MEEVSVDRVDDGWSAVAEALQDPRWDYRSVSGIVGKTELTEESVKSLLRKNRSKLRQRRSGDGRPIYTLKSKPMKIREILAELQVYASKSL